MSETMKAIAVDDTGALVVREAPIPTPLPGEIRIKVAAAGLNRADVLQRQGKYPPPAGAIDRLGLEVSGYVDAVGLGVETWREGQAVCALLPSGGYAEYAIAHAGSVLPVPEGVTLEEAASLPETVMTVWTNVFDMCALKPGESFLVQGGASGIGVTAIQMARALGAKVFATAGSDAKCQACVALGAEAAFNYRTEDFEKELSARGGVDVVLDMVAGDYVDKHINILKPHGRLVHIAVQGGVKAEINILKIMLKRLIVTGSTLRARTDVEKAVIAQDVAATVWPWIAEGKVRPVVDSVFPLAEAGAAHERLTSGDHVGKIILTT